MTLDAWLPIGHTLPDGAKCLVPLFEGPDWQVVETPGAGRALIVHDDLASRWLSSGLLADGILLPFKFGGKKLYSFSCGPSQMLCPVWEGKSPDTKNEALAFALALKGTRLIDSESPLQDAIYIEKISRLLPTYSISPRMEDDVILGYWLTGGAAVSVNSFRRLRHILSWMGTAHLKEVVEAAGFQIEEIALPERRREPKQHQESQVDNKEDATALHSSKSIFELPGRPDLEGFFSEYVIDIVQNRERYQSFGIGFPSAIVLHGPPGCGKTFAVDQLVNFLGWPSFQIDASSVASPYIHETSRKIADVFEKAMQSAPSVLIIDEMEAFLADREMGVGRHHIEEVAEFLRRIPEATENEVLIIAMTNRIDMIDPAILRRGRFDHIIKVDYPSETDVKLLLDKLMSSIPKSSCDAVPLAKQLAGRPLSDTAFVVREGARLAARAGKDQLDQESLLAALAAAPARDPNVKPSRPIGFI